jgi:hypothetical protein
MNKFTYFIFILFSFFIFSKNQETKKEKPFALNVFSCIIRNDTLENDIKELIKLGYNKNFTSLIKEGFNKYSKLSEVYHLCYERYNKTSNNVEEKIKETNKNFEKEDL